MRLLFQHLAGRITHTDWQYSPMYAVFEKSEYKKALDSGWLPHEYDPPLWFQARQVRYRLNALEHHKKRKIPKRVDFEICYHRKNWERYKEIWEIYLEKKGFDGDQPLERLFDLDPDKKIIVEVYDYDELVAFSVIRIDPVPVSLQFAWTYHDPKLSLGIHCQYFEMQSLLDLGFEYDYVCPGYEDTCIWKSRFPGFEFWTGTEWSGDRDLYERLCKRDSMIIDPDDLSNDDPLPLSYDFEKMVSW